jgi:hypothetical protein
VLDKPVLATMRSLGMGVLVAAYHSAGPSATEEILVR